MERIKNYKHHAVFLYRGIFQDGGHGLQSGRLRGTARIFVCGPDVS